MQSDHSCISDCVIDWFLDYLLMTVFADLTFAAPFWSLQWRSQMCYGVWFVGYMQGDNACVLARIVTRLGLSRWAPKISTLMFHIITKLSFAMEASTHSWLAKTAKFTGVSGVIFSNTESERLNIWINYWQSSLPISWQPKVKFITFKYFQRLFHWHPRLLLSFIYIFKTSNIANMSASSKTAMKVVFGAMTIGKPSKYYIINKPICGSIIRMICSLI